MNGFVFSRSIDKTVDEAREGRSDLDEVIECDGIHILEFMIPKMNATSLRMAKPEQEIVTAITNGYWQIT